jgi:hypothetical protein
LIHDNYNDMLWLSGEDPVKLDAFTRMPILEYFIMLDTRVKGVKKQIQKNGNKAGNNRVYK